MKTVHTDVREMRKAIHQAARGSFAVNGGPGDGWMRGSPAAVMIKAALDAGHYAGWSGEDIMTALAYHALLGYEDVHARLLQTVMLQPSLHPIHPEFTRAESDRPETRMNTGL